MERYRHVEGAFFALVDWHLHPKIARENAYKGWGHRSVVAVILNKVVEVGLRPMNEGRLQKILRMPLDTGWMHFEMMVNWSSDPKKGSVRIKLQQDSVAMDGIPTLYMDDKHHFQTWHLQELCAYRYRSGLVSERAGRWKALDTRLGPSAKGAGKGTKERITRVLTSNATSATGTGRNKCFIQGYGWDFSFFNMV